jgi:hypothetical protein
MAISGQTGAGLDELWAAIEEHRAALETSGGLQKLRAEQGKAWMWALILERLERAFRADPRVAARLTSVEADVLAGKVTPTAGADALPFARVYDAALFAASLPSSSPRRVGMQFGATKLKRTASKQSKPHPNQAARSTVHWVRSMSRKRGREIAAVVMPGR